MDHPAGPILGSPTLTSANIRLQDWPAGPLVSAPSSLPQLKDPREATVSESQLSLL